ncbi:Response regulator receiver domain protein [Phaeobacter inhibens]|nr:Response regulator receiver domain protein [Phaeobacter inhibens]
MARTTASTTVVVLDDELFNIEWLLDFLTAQGYETIPSSSASEAIEIVSEEIYRALILDLNVPMSSDLIEAAGKLGSVYKKYPGLFVARTARNAGYRDRQIIIYSVHRDVEVAQEASRLGITYILKGRPAELKSEIDAVLSFDPTTAKE